MSLRGKWQEVLENWLRGDLGSYAPKVVLADNPSSPGVDAFGRSRVSQSVDLFYTQFEYDDQPLFWDSWTTGSATAAHSYDMAGVILNVSGSSVALRQTRGYLRYQPGKSQKLTFTYQHTPYALSRWQAGYFEDRDGIFLEHSGTSVSLVLRSSVSGSVSETRVPQSQWNMDRLDGSLIPDLNPSGESLDHTMAQHLVLDMQWQGVGIARAGFYLDGQIRYAHRFRGDNSQPYAFMRTANLPVRCELRGLAAGAFDSALQICQAVESEGGVGEEIAQPFDAAMGHTGTSVTSRVPLMTIRPALTFDGHANRSTHIIPKELSVVTDDQGIYWELIYGGIVSGSTSWVPIGSESAIEMDRGANLIFGGLRVASGYLSAGDKATAIDLVGVNSRLRLALGIEGAHPTAFPTDNLTVVVTSLTTATTVRASMRGKEIK